MKFGKTKEYTRRNKKLVIPVGPDGIGTEEHPVMELPKPTNIDEMKIFEIIAGKNEEEEQKPEAESKGKLYLNTIINLLSNKRRKFPRKPFVQRKIPQYIVNWWRKETTNDLKDLIKFITIHGLLGAPVLLSLLTMTNVDIYVVDLIKQSMYTILGLYILGTGGAYYLFLDVHEEIKNAWASKRNKK